MDILKTIQTIIKKDYPQIKQKINLDTVLSKIDYIDSLELATIAITLEEKYGCYFSDQQLEEMKDKTIAEIIQEIECLIKIQKAANN